VAQDIEMGRHSKFTFREHPGRGYLEVRFLGCMGKSCVNGATLLAPFQPL